MTQSVYRTLSAHGRRICRRLVGEEEDFPAEYYPSEVILAEGKRRQHERETGQDSEPQYRTGAAPRNGTLAELGFSPAVGGASEVRSDHVRELREQGWTILREVVDADWLAQLRARYDELISAEGAMAGLDAAPDAFQQSVREGREPHPNPGFRQLQDVVNKGEVFDRLWTHPSMLTLVASALPDFKLFSLNGLDPKPGCGHQPFHRDTLAGPEPDGDWTIVNSVWMLDDFCQTTGATRVVSESHVRDVDSGPGSPSVRYAEAPAGSVRPIL